MFNFEKSLQFFTSITARIEVVIDDKNKEIYFPLLPHFEMLNDRIQREFYNLMDRTSLESKHQSLLKAEKLNIKLKIEYKF